MGIDVGSWPPRHYQYINEDDGHNLWHRARLCTYGRPPTSDGFTNSNRPASDSCSGWSMMLMSKECLVP
eukprot:scaffold15261_cov89-Skeletonema_dohrnii-CCMP3373.AAC.3